MKSIIAGSIIAVAMAISSVPLATPASALNIHVGPRGVGVGVGGRYRGWHRGPYVRRGPYVHRYYRRGVRRF